MYRPAGSNLITDIAGLRVGHATDDAVRSGVTALICGGAWSAGVDVRGGGPGGRETDALSPENLAGRAHAVVPDCLARAIARAVHFGNPSA
jgi:L-aminopeptidase/D-esterase-like protein